MGKCHKQIVKVIARLADLSSMQMGHTANAMQPIAIEVKTELERVLFQFASCFKKFLRQLEYNWRQGRKSNQVRNGHHRIERI